jgi:hypothetical protein
MTLNNQKEQFSIAYARAIAAAAGFKVYREEVDDESVDIGVARSGGNGTVRSPRCDIQLKCTSQEVLDSTQIRFPLPLKNYDDLRGTDLHVPRILVVLLVPDLVTDWLVQDEQSLRLYRCAYWLTLRGEPATANATSVTVVIPRGNIFGVAALEDIMNRIEQGGHP